MRNTLLLSTCLFLLSACGGKDDYWGDKHHDNDRYNNGYGGYNGYNNGGYYPYGNANYPRDRIYIVDGYHACHGYIYQGYCYRDKDDYRAAMIWDQKHRNDANWNRKRKDWCNSHDCSRDHDMHGDRDDYDHHDRRDYHRNDKVLDAQGKPLQSPPERDRSETLQPKPVHRQHENHHDSSNRRAINNSQPVIERAPERQQQPAVQQQPVYRQPLSEPVRRVQPHERHQPQESQSQERRPQRGRSEVLNSGSSE